CAGIWNTPRVWRVWRFGQIGRRSRRRCGNVETRVLCGFQAPRAEQECCDESALLRPRSVISTANLGLSSVLASSRRFGSGFTPSGRLKKTAPNEHFSRFSLRVDYTPTQSPRAIGSILRRVALAFLQEPG